MAQSTIHFFGGAGTVTGSNFMLDTGSAKFLIDCGLFQGEHSFDQSNWEPFPFAAGEITALINTHAHIDHIGRIPKLVKDGYRGPIISTVATKALAGPMLLDALELNEHDAKRHGKEPLYDKDDIAQALRQWQGIGYHEPREFGGATMQFLNSGHILGSAMAQFSRGDRSVVFTGDLGGGNSPLLPHAEVPQNAQYLVMESVYGDKVREDDTHRRDLLENIIEDTIARGGTLLIPAFSTERTQDLLFEIRALMLEKRVPEVPVYLDSPLAEKVTAAYEECPQYFSPEVEARVKAGEHIFAFPNLHFVEHASESQKLQEDHKPKIIIAGSGMSNGGRVMGHERTILPDEKSTLLVVGYQAAGSPGRRLIEGARELRMHGESIPVRCHIEEMYGYSAHMNGEQLLEFANAVSDPGQKGRTSPFAEVFVVMGEPASSSFLAQRIRDYLGVRATVPEAGEKATIDL